jgi:sec-independent protein translocase protein TatA
MGEFSVVHWLVVAIVIMVLFGAKRLPGIGRSLGESIREFKKALNDDALKTTVKELSDDVSKK